MADEVSRGLVQSKNYCNDRLAELKTELVLLQEEATALKAELEATADAQQAGLIRRRRMYLSRRISELKTERAARTEERQTAMDRLTSLAQ